MMSLRFQTKNFLHAKFVVGFFVSTAFLFVGVSSAHAATIIDVVYTPSGAVVGTFIAASATTTTFSPASTGLTGSTTAPTTGSTTLLTFPTGTTLTDFVIAASDFTIRQQSNGGGSCVNGVDTAPAAIATTTTTITLTVAAAALSNSCGTVSDNGKGLVVIKTSATAGANEIRHPTAITTTGTFSVDLLNDSGTTTTVTFIADAATDVRVETVADGSGVVVPAQNLNSNSSLTAYSITRDQFSNFVANVAATAWSLTDKTGDIYDIDLGPAGNSKSAIFTASHYGTTKIQATSDALTVTKSGIITVVSAGGSATFDHWGCTNPLAINYNRLSNKDDGSCKIAGEATPAMPTTPTIPAIPATPAIAATPATSVPPPSTLREAMIAEIMAKIASLQAEIKAKVKETPNVNAVVSANVNASFKQDLYRGVTNDDVRMLQEWLNTHGYIIAPDGPGSPGSETAFFGELTRLALAKFQEARGIAPALGYFGPKTRAALAKE